MEDIFLDEDKFNSFCEKNNIVIRFDVPLNFKTKGFCYYDGEYYNIFINPSLSYYQARKTILHELIHIHEKHFSNFIEQSEVVENETDILVNDMSSVYG